MPTKCAKCDQPAEAFVIPQHLCKEHMMEELEELEPDRIQSIVVDFSNNQVTINGVVYQVDKLTLKFENESKEKIKELDT